jgi:hypothetical protein
VHVGSSATGFQTRQTLTPAALTAATRGCLFAGWEIRLPVGARKFLSASLSLCLPTASSASFFFVRLASLKPIRLFAVNVRRDFASTGLIVSSQGEFVFRTTEILHVRGLSPRRRS